MKGVLLFGGTTEGRLLERWLEERSVPLTVCVATEYGRDLLEPGPGTQVLTGRLGQTDMEDLMERLGRPMVLDATHPYAVEVSQNIRGAALSSDCPCLRLLRPAGQEEEITAADSVAQAVELLRGTTGNILAATGSKELAAYTALEDFSNRVYPRVLPTCQAIALCEELGFASSHIIAMQGPFSRGLNEALMRQYQIRYLVTKDGGGAGGFEEKLEAARQVGAQVVLVCRPDGDQGLTLDEIKEKLTRWMEGP